MVYRYLPSVRSVGVAVFTAAGSGNETSENNGISHFIEHMMFKGTQKRTAFDIVENADSLGAQINAFTSKQSTCFYTLSLNEVVPQCVEIISDMLFNHTFDEEEMKREKGVVMEEIAMGEDDNVDVLFDLSESSYFNNNPLGMTILGPKENIKNFTREQLLEYVENNYASETTVISIVGYIKFDEAKALVEQYFEGRFKSNPNRIWQDTIVENMPKYKFKFKDIEQSNFTITMPGLSYKSKDRSILNVVNNILGAGMSSRLFQEVREKQGLAYNVYSNPTFYVNNGTTDIYVGTNLLNVEKSIVSIKDCMNELCEKGFTEQEIEKGKMQIKSAYIMGQESTSALMRVYGKTALYFNEVYDLDEKIKEINKVTVDEANRVLKEAFDISKASLTYVGPKIEGNLINLLK